VFWERNNKLFFIVMLLLAAAVANAAPTVAADSAIVVPTVQVMLDSPVVMVPDNEVVGPVDTKLANLGRELLQPPKFAVLGDTRSNNIKPLPAVPAAIFMTLSGFLCISLVRERRVWLAAIAGLLWAGQAGIQVLPQLALRLSSKNHSQQFSAELAYPHYLENSNRLRSDIDGTQYIGLLHHLEGIPVAKCRAHTLMAKYYTNKVTQFAIVKLLPEITLSTSCLASIAEQFVSFSPAFIFAQLPRGPPISA
jgi:hypothetical protein